MTAEGKIKSQEQRQRAKIKSKDEKAKTKKQRRKSKDESKDKRTRTKTTSRPMLATRAALACGFVEQDGCGGGSVQRFDGRRDRDADASVGAAFDFFWQARAFITDEKGDGLAPVDLPWCEWRLFVCGRFAGAGG